MSRALLNSIGLLILGSIIAGFWTWFWRFRTTTIARLEAEKSAVAAKADKLAAEHRELVMKVNELQQQLGLVSQVVTPINQAMQALLIRELTHYHTPELDALLAKLPPDGNLTIKEQERLAVLLKEREDELNGSIPESERDAAHILPYVIKRVLVEAEDIADAATAAPQLKIVAVPSDTGTDDMQSPSAAVEGKKDDEQQDKGARVMLGINTPVTWKVYLKGKPDAIKRSLERFSESLNGPGRADFLRAKPALDALLDLNAHTKTEISFAANGDKDHMSVLLMSSPATHVD